ncbi:Exonuclease III [Halorubrum ezzemoulense]|uniref:Exonuclease III n=1 Tax=Halorubrum ezzemoulense TaxID=337243 RepID=A0A238Y281_HALEZ|nr:endonuclease/exonuclease/phosphatase family protein [Halorubrum ezzemoulense]SNR65396.1 Exonuclease III [Halorubrum ezzemoulense]
MTIRVMSWNVNKSSNREGRINEQLEFIRNCNVDVLHLQEVRYGTDNKWLDRWDEGLTELGLGEIEHSCDWASELSDTTVPPHSDIGHDNGHITAVNTEWHLTRAEPTIRENIDESERGFFDTHFPEKVLTTSLRTANKEVDLWNIRAVPGNGWGEEKIKIFETVYDRLSAEGDKTRILTGDFNSPKAELPDGQAIPFGHDKRSGFRRRKVSAELNILKGLGHLGMRDVFREQHGYGDLEVADTSWKSKRFDHIFASDDLPATSCWYDHTGLESSDHAPIIAEFGV